MEPGVGLYQATEGTHQTYAAGSKQEADQQAAGLAPPPRQGPPRLIDIQGLAGGGGGAETDVDIDAYELCDLAQPPPTSPNAGSVAYVNVATPPGARGHRGAAPAPRTTAAATAAPVHPMLAPAS